VFREAVRTIKQRPPFYIDAFVVLPDHLHTIWMLPEEDADFATRWMLIKAQFSRRIPKVEHRGASRKKNGERGIWQQRYWEYMIRSDYDYAQHVDYIYFSPVKHGYVNHAADRVWSSIYRYLAVGVIMRDWGWCDKTETDE